MKFLIATACVVIIAGGGYFAWSEYQQKKAAEAASQERTMINGCRATLTREGSPSKALRDHCAANGYITREQAAKADRGEFTN
ncbi:hypothetical protein G6L26_007305 [Agrobacterium radiobacter]|uniref:hypothetical protein n=1 Tax=Agrobacterium radiobacter TaxID=362 RepID=UPI0036715955